MYSRTIGGEQQKQDVQVQSVTEDESEKHKEMAE